MRLCVRCGLQMPEASQEPLCAYHGTEYGERWSDGNRIMCDWIHRGIVPERVPDDTELFDPALTDVHF